MIGAGDVRKEIGHFQGNDGLIDYNGFYDFTTRTLFITGQLYIALTPKKNNEFHCDGRDAISASTFLQRALR